jgi:hypothetical protein
MPSLEEPFTFSLVTNGPPCSLDKVDMPLVLKFNIPMESELADDMGHHFYLMV